MSVKVSVRVLLLYLMMVMPALAQGFAGMGSDAEGFTMPQRGKPLVFPRDHGAHPDFRIEWWYVTANLQGTDGKDYGIQWTLFRTAIRPEEGQGWSSPQLWMAHAAVTAADRHLVAERLARGGTGQAGVTLEPFVAWIDDWSLESKADGAADPLSSVTVKASGPAFRYDLRLDATGPLVLHGEEGYSVKSERGLASYYYSQPFYRVSGRIVTDEGAVEVSGLAWLDREWSSQPLTGEQVGWDWFSFHFDDGAKLMGYHLRDGGEGYTAATWIGTDGRVEIVPSNALKTEPLELAEVAGRKVPVRWRVTLPAKGLDVMTRPLNPQSWMTTQISYWEGPCSSPAATREKAMSR